MQERGSRLNPVSNRRRMSRADSGSRAQSWPRTERLMELSLAALQFSDLKFRPGGINLD